MSIVVPDPALNDWVPMWNLGGVPPGPGCRVYSNSTQNCPSGSTALYFELERFDTDNMHDTTAGQNGKITIRTPGRYIIGANIHVPSTPATASRDLLLYLNGGLFQIDRRSAAISGGTQLTTNAVWDCAAGDVLTVNFQHAESGSMAPYLGGSYTMEFWAVMVGGLQGPAGVGVPTPVVNGSVIKGVGGQAAWAVAAGTELYFGTIPASSGVTGISPNPGDVILNMGNIVLEAGANYVAEMVIRGAYCHTTLNSGLYFGVYDAAAATFLGAVAFLNTYAVDVGTSGAFRQNIRNVANGGSRALNLRWFGLTAGASYAMSGAGTGTGLELSLQKA